MDRSGPRYRDREDSRFYRACGLSPEETWQALTDELARVLDDAQRAFWRTPLRMDPERIRWWHGEIFARHFPRDGGRFRQGQPRVLRRADAGWRHAPAGGRRAAGDP